MKLRTAIIASVLSSSLLTAGCKQQTEAPEPVRPVLSTIVEPKPSGSTVAAGTVAPRYETSLGFRVLGRVISRPVNVGDLVAEGQAVAAIDSTTLELAVQSAKADLSKVQALLANARATEQRKRSLITSDASTKQMLDDAVQARAGAEASVARAEANHCIQALLHGLEQMLVLPSCNPPLWPCLALRLARAILTGAFYAGVRCIC